jgi:outer membrane protein assembly factor BamB
VDYRDDRDALRNRIDELEQQAKQQTDARERVVALEDELRQAREQLARVERELGAMRSPRRTSPVVPVLVGLGGLLVTCGVAGGLFAVRMRAQPRPPPVDAPPMDVSPRPGSAANEHLQWGLGFGPSVAPVAINDDAVEDFVGVYRVLTLNGASTQTAYLGAFNGKTLEQMWATPPLGAFGDAISSTHFALVGRRVVVTDFRSNVHVLELATGRELGALQLTDKARRVCASPREPNRVWIEVVDDKHVMIDLETLKASPEKRPAWCSERAPFEPEACEASSARCAQDSFTTAGFKAAYVLTDDATRVAIGTRHPGTATPMAVGLDAHLKPTWTLVLPNDPAIARTGAPLGDLVRGTLFAAYAPGDKGLALVAINAGTGARLWETPIPRSGEGSGPRGITATPTRIYVPHWTWLDVFESDGGKLVGTVGVW